MPTLATLPEHCEAVLQAIARHRERDDQSENFHALADALEKSIRAARLLTHRLATLADLAKSMAMAMEFGFLFDADRQLLSIGYRGADSSLDPNYYDLLASEARLASFFAIAKGDIPAKHWFRLGRTLTPINGGSGLISWSGSMFEYLMPSLVMRAPAGSLLEQTNRLVVLAAGRIRRRARRALGHVGIGILMRATSSRPINIRASAFPISATSAA